MASLTRSASLTSLINKPSRNEDDDEESDSGRQFSYYYESLKSSNKKSQQSTSQNGYQQRSLNLLGRPAGNSLKNWKWLTTAKTFHGTPPSPTNQRRNVSFRETNLSSTQSYSNKTNKLLYQYENNVDYQKRQKAERGRFMDHLEELLPEFCSILSHPTYQNAADAMSFLLNTPPPPPPEPEYTSSDAPASPQKSHGQNLFRPQKNEEDTKVSVTSEMNRLLSSPFRVRKRRERPQKPIDKTLTNMSSAGFTGTTGSIKQQDMDLSSKGKSAVSNKFDEAAWQEFCTPLLLLAGAEAIYADLEHVHPNPSIIHWSGLYQRVANDLSSLLPIPDENEPPSPPQQQRQPTTSEAPLTVPFQSPDSWPAVVSPPRAERQTSQRETVTAATQLPGSTESAGVAHDTDTIDAGHKNYNGLRSLCEWLDLKCQWIPFRESLFLTWSPDNLMFLRAFSSAQGALSASASDDVDKGGSISSQPLMQALQEEILVTQSLLEMAFWLERGRFLDTIISAQKVKKQFNLVSHKSTALVLWAKTAFQDFLSMMPLIFDRIHAFAHPLYGFDQQVLLEATQKERTFQSDSKGVVDLDSIVSNFLRRQEKASGTPTSVAIVLNTEGLQDDEGESQDCQTSQPSREQTRPATKPTRLAPRVELGFALHKNSMHPPGEGNNRIENFGTTALPILGQGQGSSSAPESKIWPPIYLRSSMRLKDPPNRGSGNTNGGNFSLINGMRRNAASVNRGSGTGLEMPQNSPRSSSSHLSNRTSWSSENAGASPRSKYTRSPNSNRSLLANGNVLEYEPDSGSASWPHSEWPQLKLLLESLASRDEKADVDVVTDEPPPSPGTAARSQGDPIVRKMSTLEEDAAFTFHPEGVDLATGEKLEPSSNNPSLLDTNGGLFANAPELPRPLWPTVAASSGGRTSSNHAPTTFHGIHLSNYMWMVVMVKGEEESRWHRRKSRGLPDEEIRAFLNMMASKLRVSSRFIGLKTCQTARVMVKDPLAPRVRGRDLGLRDALWKTNNPDDNNQVKEEVLPLLKDAFGVTGISPILNRAESILTNMSASFRKTGQSRSPLDRRRYVALSKMSGPYAENSDYREGAALLFLGPELFRQFLESTNE